jgi:hypothetical protein
VEQMSNIYEVLANADEERTKKSEKERKLENLLKAQKKTANAQVRKEKRFVPKVDVTNPDKRLYEKISGTGREYDKIYQIKIFFF